MSQFFTKLLQKTFIPSTLSTRYCKATPKTTEWQVSTQNVTIFQKTLAKDVYTIHTEYQEPRSSLLLRYSSAIPKTPE
ncbi:hypothetical protein TSAR_006095 [Trichomalopsis sarcophagae]|uniref:Uncharacterized protein n=1 Tax=Trichomalopsis sarcophagae TaxID=543379 RepID=A0A232ELT7_9HYME|nr:hypothetical protein TSAR_006095 [Trichomalopsis sarcophagae]